MITNLQALPHVASLLGAARTPELDHVLAEDALSAVCSLARLTLLASTVEIFKLDTI